MEGWILKKKRRLGGGWVTRWLRLYGNGNLEYFRNPGSYSRGTVNLKQCAIRLDHGIKFFKYKDFFVFPLFPFVVIHISHLLITILFILSFFSFSISFFSFLVRSSSY